MRVILSLFLLILLFNANIYANEKEFLQKQKADFHKLKIECSSKNMEACYHLGFKYFRGHGVAMNKKKGLELFDKTCNSGNTMACYNTADIYKGYSDTDVKKNYKKVQHYLKKGCDFGMGQSCYDLAGLYLIGDYIRINSLKAKEYFGKACDNDYSDGCSFYKRMEESKDASIQ